VHESLKLGSPQALLPRVAGVQPGNTSLRGATESWSSYKEFGAPLKASIKAIRTRQAPESEQPVHDDPSPSS
jgi:hypothetical protein